MTRHPWERPALIVLVIVSLLAWAPLAGVLISSAVASAFGCTLNEAGAHACVIAGVDVGGALAVLFVAGWLMLVTAPVMLLTLLVWIIVIVIAVVRRQQRASRI